MTSRDETTYHTAGGLGVTRTLEPFSPQREMVRLAEQLNDRLGALFSSSYEYPGRYTRWDIGFINPPLRLVGHGLTLEVEALNMRGRVLLAAFEQVRDVQVERVGDTLLRLSVAGPADGPMAEEQRSRRPSLLSILRAAINYFQSSEDPHLGFYGAFGYDLTFQFAPIVLRQERDAAQRDLVLYLPDELWVVDHQKGVGQRITYEFTLNGESTYAHPREGGTHSYVHRLSAAPCCDHAAGAYAATVVEAKKAFATGDLFEVVPSQTFSEPCDKAPATLFETLKKRNPSPYGFLINLGESEFLVGASPEMYVRVEDGRVETCPISGTIARGKDPLGDAKQIQTLLNSEKDTAELTMCTDVDRNDKSRVCIPGSVRVIGRRQIEMYSRLIHTVDHVEGILRPEFDALDAFLTHTWAVTVTGAPKARAMQFIENHEESPRRWYGGAVGVLNFNGHLNTGLTLRTIHLRDGLAHVRSGATLLFDSEPEAEEQETRLKASALLDVVRQDLAAEPSRVEVKATFRRNVLLVDHSDSFVHTLANYLRQTGAEVVTLRPEALDSVSFSPDLLVLSPGPGRPADFNMDRTLQMARDKGIPTFGVCLGLQGIVEHFGGKLHQLEAPMHGKSSMVRGASGTLFSNLPATFSAGRYHSLYVREDELPQGLRSTARTDEQVVMAIEHESLPIAAVQFHPESIMTLEGDLGYKIICNVVRSLR